MAQEQDLSKDLTTQIWADFSREYNSNVKTRTIELDIKKGTATYEQALEYADITGGMLAKAFGNNLSSEVLPDGRMSYEMASAILSPTLGQEHKIVSDICVKVQENLNKKAGLSLKAVAPEMNTDKVDGFARRIGREESFDNVSWILDEPVKTFSCSIVDDAIKANADFQYEAGLVPKIIRTAEANCCPWCAGLEGEYDYPVDEEIYKRHNNCRCVVDYYPGDGKKQNAHTKTWSDADREERILADRLTNTELYRRKIGPRGNEIVDKPTYQKLTRDFRRQGGEIIRGEQAVERLGEQGGLYISGANVAYLRDDATVSEVLEEMFHAKQDRRGDYIDLPIDEMKYRREIDAQNYLLEMTKRYKIPVEEVNETKHNLEYYEKMLQSLIDER